MRRVFVGALLALLAVGCAKFPDEGSSGDTTRLLFTARVDGELRTGLGGGGLPYVYLIALRLSTVDNPTDQGPIPVVVPGGNGFVAGNATHFILFDPLASPSYQIWRFTDTSLNEYFQTGSPINWQPVSPGDDTLSFEIDLSQLVPADQVPSIRSIQANFLTMNNRNTSGGGRVWDALGDSRNPGEVNSFLTFQLNSSRTFTNANTGNLEPQGDTADPDLDLVDWSIEVRLR